MTKKLLLMAMLATTFVACTKNDDSNIVDLGLPSGIKWAKTNVGAANPWDCGDYYAWGETQAKTDYDWSTYKYGNRDKLTKYCNNADSGNDGFTDALVTLESADDVATAVLGADYSMPTIADWEELCSQCYWVWTSKYEGQDISGYIVYKVKSDADKGVIVNAEGTPSKSYSLSDAHIFLPLVGSRFNSSLPKEGLSGIYWSSSLNEKSPNCARYCYFDSGSVRPHPSWYYDRCNGFSVRPVKRP
ncbi:MAG: hypothetical protein IKW86_01190 [Salinivirgaceae bacterium]|nr:hypothetical protein [Salinivirgaceae bacterium]